MLARRDAGDHVGLRAVDQLIRQALETVGQRPRLCRLRLARLRGVSGADQVDNLRDDADEPVVDLPNLAEQFRLVLGDELQPFQVIAERSSWRSAAVTARSFDSSSAEETPYSCSVVSCCTWR